MNPITIYMIHNLVDVGQIAQRLVGGDLNKLYLGRFGDLVVALGDSHHLRPRPLSVSPQESSCERELRPDFVGVPIDQLPYE